MSKIFPLRQSHNIRALSCYKGSSLCSMVETDLNFLLAASCHFFYIVSVYRLLGLGGASFFLLLTIFVMDESRASVQKPSADTLIIKLSVELNGMFMPLDFMFLLRGSQRQRNINQGTQVKEITTLPET